MGCLRDLVVSCKSCYQRHMGFSIGFVKDEDGVAGDFGRLAFLHG